MLGCGLGQVNLGYVGAPVSDPPEHLTHVLLSSSGREINSRREI